VWLSEQTGTFALHTMNRLVFITEVESVYSAVRTDSLHNTDKSLVFIIEVESVYSAVRNDSLHNTDKSLVFIIEVESVYSAVRTESIYNTDTFPSQRVKKCVSFLTLNGRMIKNKRYAGGNLKPWFTEGATSSSSS
jgi:hypothetical protein